MSALAIFAFACGFVAVLVGALALCQAASDCDDAWARAMAELHTNEEAPATYQRPEA